MCFSLSPSSSNFNNARPQHHCLHLQPNHTFCWPKYSQIAGVTVEFYGYISKLPIALVFIPFPLIKIVFCVEENLEKTVLISQAPPSAPFLILAHVVIISPVHQTFLLLSGTLWNGIASFFFAVGYAPETWGWGNVIDLRAKK